MQSDLLCAHFCSRFCLCTSDSKLTRLLSDSLGGNSKTVLIITGSPMNTNMEETQSTCRFGLRAKLIQNKAKINQEKSVAEYKILLHQATLKLGIQAEIIAALEKDVAALLECVSAVDPPSALKIPIPALISQDPEMMAQFQRESGADPGATGNDVSMALTVPTSLPPVAKSPAPAGAPTLSASNSLNLGSSPMPPSTPQPPTTPRPPPPPSTSPPVAAAPAAAGAAAASASTSPPPAAAAATAGLVTPVKPTARAVRHPVAGGSSGDDSPPTSPDTSPDSSPVLGPTKPPVVTMGLPSLASLAASSSAATAAAAAPAAVPAASPAASNPVPAYRKPSAVAGHSMSELMLANSDLHQQVAELRQARLALEHNLADNRSETQELTESFEKDKKAMADAVEEAQRLRKEAEERAEKAMETVTELNALKQKIEYLKKEQALALSQSDAARTEALEEKDALASRVAVLEAKMAAQRAAHEAVMNKLASENAAAASAAAAAAASAAAASASVPFEDPLTSPSAVSAPNTPQASSATERKILRPRMSEPPQSSSGMVRTHVREASNDMHPLLASSGGRGSISGASGLLPPPELAAPEFTIEEQNQIEQLNRGLKRKCDQYIQLMMQHQAQGERVESVREQKY